jgi:hypothetical protein
MHDGGGGGFGSGHLGGGHGVSPAHHQVHHRQQGSNGSADLGPGHLGATTGLRQRGSPGFQRVAPALGVTGMIVIVFIVLLVI